MSAKPISLTRRKAIKNAVVLLGGTIAAAQLGPLVGSVAAMDEDSVPRFLSTGQYSMLERIVDLIIPETDTPGALSAGVHRFIDLMLAEWASPETRTRYVDGLQSIDRRARDGGAESFSASSPSQQLELLETLDVEAYAENAGDSLYKDLKTLILFGYYSSEEGASVELRFDRLPGAYLDCVQFDDFGRAWSN